MDDSWSFFYSNLIDNHFMNHVNYFSVFWVIMDLMIERLTILNDLELLKIINIT